MTTAEALHTDHLGHEVHQTYEAAAHQEQHSHPDNQAVQDTLRYSYETMPDTHNIGLKEGLVCSADCPEHGHKHHGHDAHLTSPSHETSGRGHSIEHKHAEHRCTVDCLEHSHGSHTGNDHRSSEHVHRHTHTIEHKPHVCGSDCPEHDTSRTNSLSAHEHAEHGHHAHTVERKTHACGADCPEHSAKDTGVHHTHRHETPGHSEQTAKHHEQDISHLQTPAEDAAYRAVMEATQRAEHAETEVATTKYSASAERPKAATLAPDFQLEQSRENMAEPVKTLVLAELPETAPAEPHYRLERTPEATFVPTHGEAAIGLVETSLSSSEQAKLPQESATVEPLQAEAPAHTVPIQYEFPPEPVKPEQPEESLTHTVPEALSLDWAPTESPLTALETESAFISPEAQPLATDQEIGKAWASSAESAVSTAEIPTPPEFPSLSGTRSGNPQTEAEVPSLLTLGEQIPSESVTELAETMAETIVTALETASQQPTYNPKQQAALQHSLARLRELQKNTPEQNDTARLHQEIVRLLGLLGYRNPAQTFDIYLQRYGERFAEELLLRLFELLAQGRSFEQTTSQTTPAQSYTTLQTNNLSVGAFILRLCRLNARLLHPAVSFPAAA